MDKLLKFLCSFALCIVLFGAYATAKENPEYYPKGDKISTRPMIVALQYNPKIPNRTSIVLTASNSIKYTAFKRETAGGLQLVIDLEGLELGNFVKPILLYKYPVTIIKPEYFLDNNVSRIIFSLKEDTEYEIIREGNERIVINFIVPEKPADVEEVLKEEPKKYKGEPISIDFERADLVQILRFLTDLSGKNVLISPNVSGTFSISLKKPLPWDQVLDIILSSNNLEMEEDENIIRIKTLAEFQEERTLRATALASKAAMLKQAADNTELITYLMPVSYASIDSLLTQLQSLSGANGSIQADHSTNQIIITDTVENINRMKDLAKQLDVRTKQVSIEVRLVNIDSASTESLGFNWSIAGSLGDGFNNQLTSAAISAGAVTATLTPVTAFTAMATIDALETKNKAKTISNPKIVTSDNQAAKISSGQTKQIATTDANTGQTTYEPVTAELNLNVTPHTTLDGYVKLTLTISNDAFVDAISTSINTQSVTTELYVKDGHTAVLGGIFKETGTDTHSGVPVLSSIPILGYFFGTNSDDTQNQELMIFVTPKISENREL